MNEKGGFMESNLIGYDHKFLSGQIMVGSLPHVYVYKHVYNLFSKGFIFSLSKPCALFLYI